MSTIQLMNISMNSSIASMPVNNIFTEIEQFLGGQTPNAVIRVTQSVQAPSYFLGSGSGAGQEIIYSSTGPSAPAGISAVIENSTLREVGALRAGSITDSFGNIDIGDSTMDAGSYSVDGTQVLNGNTLGSSVVSSSLTSVGTLTSGDISPNFGHIDIGTNNITCGTIIANNLHTDTQTTILRVGNLTVGSISSGFGNIDNRPRTISTSRYYLPYDGTGIDANGSIVFGAGQDAGIWFDGTRLRIQTVDQTSTYGMVFNTSDDDSYSFQMDGNTAFQLVANGSNNYMNVGINRTTPIYPLDVRGDDEECLRLVQGPTGITETTLGQSDLGRPLIQAVSREANNGMVGFHHYVSGQPFGAMFSSGGSQRAIVHCGYRLQTPASSTANMRSDLFQALHTGSSGAFVIDDGAFHFFSSTSGTVGTDVSVSEFLRISNQGNLEVFSAQPNNYSLMRFLPNIVHPQLQIGRQDPNNVSRTGNVLFLSHDSVTAQPLLYLKTADDNNRTKATDLTPHATGRPAIEVLGRWSGGQTPLIHLYTGRNIGVRYRSGGFLGSVSDRHCSMSVGSIPLPDGTLTNSGYGIVSSTRGLTDISPNTATTNLSASVFEIQDYDFAWGYISGASGNTATVISTNLNNLMKLEKEGNLIIGPNSTNDPSSGTSASCNLVLCNGTIGGAVADQTHICSVSSGINETDGTHLSIRTGYSTGIIYSSTDNTVTNTVRITINGTRYNLLART